jgi:hypothetical protein
MKECRGWSGHDRMYLPSETRSLRLSGRPTPNGRGTDRRLSEEIGDFILVERAAETQCALDLITSITTYDCFRVN